VGAFVFSDDNFFVDKHRSYRILDGIVRQMPDIVWSKGDMRLDLLSQLDDDFLRLIEQSGCASLSIGVESGSERIAEIMRKEIDISQAIPANRRLTQYSMSPHYAFVLGIPGETEADLAKTASLMLTLVEQNRKATNGVTVYVPYPGTDLFDLSIKCGLVPPTKLEDWIPRGWMNRRANYPWLSPKARQLIQMLSFCSLFLTKDKSMKRLSPDISPLVSTVARLYNPLARKRVQGLHTRYLLEQKIAELFGYRGS